MDAVIETGLTCWLVQPDNWCGDTCPAKTMLVNIWGSNMLNSLTRYSVNSPWASGSVSVHWCRTVSGNCEGGGGLM
jgi:hypothetical protein